MKNTLLLLSALWSCLGCVSAEVEAEKRLFQGIISGSEKAGILKVNISIYHADHKSPLQSVYLRRKSETGLDLHIPIHYYPEKDCDRISLMLPFGYSKDTFLDVTHEPEKKKVKPADVGKVSAARSRGESYHIPLKPNTPY